MRQAKQALRIISTLALGAGLCCGQYLSKGAIPVPLGGGGISVIDGTYGFSGSSSTSNSAHNLNVQAGDQLWILAHWSPSTFACTAPTFTWTFGGGSETVVQEGGNALNNWVGGQCVGQFTVQSIANATATETIQLVITGGNVNTSGVSGFKVGQMRGTAHAVADQVNCNNTSGPPSTTARVPASSGSTSPCSDGTLTTTHAAAIIWAGVANPSNASPTPTTSGCFGSTGTTPSNTTPGTDTSAIQYVILSSTATDFCSFTQSSSTFNLQIAAYH